MTASPRRPTARKLQIRTANHDLPLAVAYVIEWWRVVGSWYWCVPTAGMSTSVAKVKPPSGARRALRGDPDRILEGMTLVNLGMGRSKTEKLGRQGRPLPDDPSRKL